MISPISIVIPVYNAEKYLAFCLDSIKAQTYADWEAILVDDGSTDNSCKICERYAKTDSRFTVIHQQNYGASTARNLGIEHANGEWITFIDADDYIDTNYLESLYKHTPGTDRTLIIQGLKHISNNKVFKEIEFEEEELIGKDIEKAFDSLKIFEHGFTVAKLYNNRIIKENRILFNNEISYSEDLLFMLEYLHYCTSIKFIGNSGYNYRTDASVLSRRYNSFENEFQLFENYYRLNNTVCTKFAFQPTTSSNEYGALILMRSIYSMFINKDRSRQDRYDIIRNIRKEKYTYIKKYYKPQITLFKAIKLALLIHPVLFDIICKLKFR